MDRFLFYRLKKMMDGYINDLHQSVQEQEQIAFLKITPFLAVAN